LKDFSASSKARFGTIDELPIPRLVTLSKTLTARLATQKERQAQAAQQAQPAPAAAGSDVRAGAVQTSCSPVAAEMKTTFFND
jgi:hypothetical protein